MASKRGADRQMTKDDDAEGEDAGITDGDGTWATADEKTLAGRTMFKAARKGGKAAAATAATAINWGASPATTAATATATAPVVAEEKTAEATVKVAPPPEKKTKKDNSKTDESSSSTSSSNGAAAAAASSSNGFSDAFAKFRPKPGQWDCPHCYVRNEKDVDKCKSCELRRDAAVTKAPDVIPQAGEKTDAEKAAADKTAALFGGASSSSNGLTKTLSGTAPETSAPSFGSFGSLTSTPSFSFGGAATTFGFGGSSAAVTFGSVATSSADGANAFAGGGALEAAATLAPEVSTHAEQFKDKKAEASGEEGDELVFKVATKVFNFVANEGGDAKGGKFVEAGTGELHMNSAVVAGKFKARLVLRTAQTQRLVLNAPVFAEMTHSNEDKWVKFLSTGVDGTTMTSYALRMKNKAEALEVDGHLTSLIAKVKANKK